MNKGIKITVPLNSVPPHLRQTIKELQQLVNLHRQQATRHLSLAQLYETKIGKLK